MAGKRRKMTAEFKTKVVLEAIKEQSSLADTSVCMKIMHLNVRRNT